MKCESCGKGVRSVNEDGYCKLCAEELAPPDEGVMCEYCEDIQATHYFGGHNLCEDCFDDAFGDPE